MKKCYDSRLFWSKVAVTQDTRRCWLWLKAIEPTGYGKTYWQERKITAHRAAFEIFYEYIPLGWVLHTCDNRQCCNPHHLYEGSATDNVRDREARGRGKHQIGKGSVRHSVEMVSQIKGLLRLGIKQTDLAKHFNVPVRLICGIKNGETRKNVPEKIFPSGYTFSVDRLH